MRVWGIRIAVLLGSLALLPLAGAQGALPRTIKIVVPFSPGGSNDVIARAIAVPLAKRLDVPVIVENKLGAQGAIATDYVARAKPDGYTFMITPASSTLAEVAFIFKRLGFDPVKHLDPVLLMAKSGLVVVVDARNPVNTIAELTEALRKKPGNAPTAL